MRIIRLSLALSLLLPLAACYYYPPQPYGCPQPVAYVPPPPMPPQEPNQNYHP